MPSQANPNPRPAPRERERESKLHLEISTVKFKIYAALSKLSQTIILPLPQRHRATASGANIITSDNQYVVVKLSGKSLNQNNLDFIGGNNEKPHPLSNGTELFDHLYREALEEANISKSDFESLILKAVIQMTRGLAFFYYEGRLNITAEELKAQFERQKEKDPDIADLVFFTHDEYLDFLENERGLIGGVVRGLV
jgi:hypothetical protein